MYNTVYNTDMYNTVYNTDMYNTVYSTDMYNTVYSTDMYNTVYSTDMYNTVYSTDMYIYNIRTLSVNIKFICTSYKNRQNSELFRPVSQRVQMNFIFNDNIRILCLSCNVKKVGKFVRFKQKGQKQASFLAFHKCCQGCLLCGTRYISTSFILFCTLRCT
jgi:hypothetical protein